MMKHFSRLMAAFVLAATMTMGFAAAPTQAATVNTLVKGSSSTVYWYAADGKRYVFPNIKTYWSWFPTLNNIQTMKDSDLSSMPLGGNVLYRPGYRLVKSATSERVYAVDRYGVLRWVTSEQVAYNLYGWDWTSKIDDIPDAFWTNYTIGAPIYNASDYNVGTAYNGVVTPSDNIGYGYNSNCYTYSTNCNGSNSVTQNNVTVTVSNTSINSGNSVTVTAQTTDTNYATFYIYDSRNNALLQTCYNVGSCSVTQNVYQNNGENNMRFYVVVNRYGNNANVYSSYVYFNGSNNNNCSNTYPYNCNNGSNTVTQNNMTVTVSNTTINSGDYVTLTATANDTSNASFTIYDLRNNSVLQSCLNTASCSTTQRITRLNSEQNMQFYVVVNRNGNSTSITSPYVYFTGSNGSNQGNVTMNVSNTNINSGDYVTVSATTQDGTAGTISIYDQYNNLVQTCSNASTCSGTVRVYQNGNQSSMQFSAIVNRNGASTTVYSPYVYFNGSNNTSTGFNSSTYVTASTSNRYTDGAGEHLTYTASVNSPNTSSNNVTVRVYDRNGNQLLQTCSNSTSCTLTLVSTSSITRTLYTVATDMNGRTVTSSDMTVTYGANGNTNLGNVNMTVSNSSINSGDYVTVSATTQDGSTGTFWIYDQNNALVQTCSNTNSCSGSTRVYQSNGQTSMQFHAVVSRGGNTVTVYSPFVSFNSNNNNNGTWTANTSLVVDRNTVNPRDLFMVTATVNNSTIPASRVQVSVFDERDGRRLGTCEGFYTCAIDTYTWRVDGASDTYRYYATFKDTLTGQTLSNAYSQYVTFTTN